MSNRKMTLYIIYQLKWWFLLQSCKQFYLYVLNGYALPCPVLLLCLTYMLTNLKCNYFSSSILLNTTVWRWWRAPLSSLLPPGNTFGRFHQWRVHSHRYVHSQWACSLPSGQPPQHRSPLEGLKAKCWVGETKPQVHALSCIPVSIYICYMYLLYM